MNNFLVPIFTSNTFEVPFLNSSLSILSNDENKPISFQKKFMSKMDSAMQVISFEDESISNQPSTLNNNQLNNFHFNEDHPISIQHMQTINNKTISFCLNYNQNPFEKTQNLLIEGLNFPDLNGEIDSNDNAINIGTNNINICLS